MNRRCQAILELKFNFYAAAFDFALASETLAIQLTEKVGFGLVEFSQVFHSIDDIDYAGAANAFCTGKWHAGALAGIGDG